MIQCMLKVYTYEILNSVLFTVDTKHWKVIQTLFNTLNVYPSVPANEVVLLIFDTIKSYISDFQISAVSFTNIHSLTELFFTTCYATFFKAVMVILQNSSTMGISLLVVITDKFLQWADIKALYVLSISSIALKVVLLIYERYFSKSQALFENQNRSESF